VEIVALKPCTLRIVEGRCLLAEPARGTPPLLECWCCYLLHCFCICCCLASPVLSHLRDRNWRQEGVNESRSKFLPKSETSAYVPKSPQALQPRSVIIVMDKLSRSRRPRSQRGSKASRNAELDCRDRSDRLHRPVRPVAPRQPAKKAPNVKSRANTVQIQRNLEESFASTP